MRKGETFRDERSKKGLCAEGGGDGPPSSLLEEGGERGRTQQHTGKFHGGGGHRSSN